VVYARTYAGGRGLTTKYVYDGGDISTVTDALNRTVTVFADAVGRPVIVRDPLGKVRRTDYDNWDRPVVLTDPLGQTVQMGYDANGNVTSFTDSRSNLTQFTYDSRNRRLSKVDGLNHTESYQYDAAGNLARVTDRKGQVSGFGYDFLDRRTSAGFGATVADPTADTSTTAYTWDAGSRLTQSASFFCSYPIVRGWRNGAIVSGRYLRCFTLALLLESLATRWFPKRWSELGSRSGSRYLYLYVFENPMRNSSTTRVQKDLIFLTRKSIV